MATKKTNATKKKAKTKTKTTKTASKKTAATKATAKKGTKKATSKTTGTAKALLKPQNGGTAKSGPTPEDNGSSKKLLEGREKHTPAVFKLPSKKSTPVVFSLEEVREVLKSRAKTEDERIEEAAKAKDDDTRKRVVSSSGEPAKKAPSDEGASQPTRRRLAAASLADILGTGSPKKAARTHSEDEVPDKFKVYYRLLMELKAHVKEELDVHTKETLKRSSKDDSGDLSSYGQHMADAGTESFDRDFALSLVSSEQDALTEINEAIERIFNGTYGICEVTGKPIPEERLMAVPFTRFSIEGQKQHERTAKRRVHRGTLFADAGDASFSAEDDDSDD